MEGNNTTERFSTSFRQQSGKIFSLESLLTGLEGPDRPNATRKKSGTFASTSGQQDTARSENMSVNYIKDGIKARHKQRAALSTMDDILNLYAREGPQEPSIFFCRATTTEERYAPYELAILPGLPATGSYYTITPTGVTLHTRGQVAVLTPMSQWVRERELYELFRQIPFFHQYILRRAFSFWKTTTKRALYERTRSKIGDLILFSRPHFQRPLNRIRQCVDRMQEQPMLTLTPQLQAPAGGVSGVWLLSEFTEMQNTVRESQCRPAMQGIADEILQAAEDMITGTQDHLKLLVEPSSDAKKIQELDQSRSLSLVKAEHAEHERKCKLAKRDFKQLGSVVRLIDYWTGAALAEQQLAASQQLLASLLPPTSASRLPTGMFVTSAMFDPSGFRFSPAEEEVVTALNKSVLDQALTMAQNLPRLLSMRALSPLFNHARPSTLTMVDIMAGTLGYAPAREQIHQAVRRDFASAGEYTVIFEDLRKIYSAGLSWDFASWSSSQRSLREIRKQLAQAAEWKTELERMKTGAVVGCLHVESKSMRTALTQIPDTIMQQVKEMLLSKAREACQSCLNDMHSRTQLLIVHPSVLYDFCTYMAMHKEQVAGKRLVLQDASAVDDMYDLLLLHKEKFTTADEVRQDDLLEHAEAYIKALRAGKEFIADTKPFQIEALNLASQALQSSMFQLAQNVADPALLNVHSAADAMMEFSAQLETTYTQLQDERNTADWQRKVLNLPALGWAALDEAEKPVQRHAQLWAACAHLQAAFISWTAKPLLDSTNKIRLDPEDVTALVDEADTVAERWLAADANDALAQQVGQAVAQAQQLLPLLVPVINSCLVDRHWTAIFTILPEANIRQGAGGFWDEFSLDTLVEAGLPEKLDQVEAVSKRATAEFAVQSGLLSMHAAWEQAPLAVTFDGEDLVVTNLPELQALASKQMEEARALRMTAGSGYFQTQAITWEDEVATMSQSVGQLQSCEAERLAVWQRLQAITGRSGAELEAEAAALPNATSAMQALQLWREAMTQAQANPASLHLLLSPGWMQQVHAAGCSMHSSLAKLK